MDLTKRQQEIFDFIHKYSAKYGYPPTVRDIGKAVERIRRSPSYSRTTFTRAVHDDDKRRSSPKPLRNIGEVSPLHSAHIDRSPRQSAGKPRRLRRGRVHEVTEQHDSHRDGDHEAPKEESEESFHVTSVRCPPVEELQ